MSSSSAFSYARTDLQEIAAEILRLARAGGASACETDVSEGVGQSVTVRKGEVDTIEYNRDKGIGVTVYLGQQRGYASTSDFAPAALKSTVEAALSIARFTAADPCAGLADAALLARQAMDLDLYHPWEIAVEEAIDIARRSEAAAFAVDPRITNSDGATVSLQQSQFASANSLGFAGGYATTRHFIACSAIASQGRDMQRDDWYDSGRDAVDLAAPEGIGETAARRAIARLDARKIGTCEVPVVFEAPLAAGLIGSFVSAASGGALYRKATFLMDSLGEQIFSPVVNLSERPHLPKGLASSPFDNDGVATHDREVVQDGVLQGYFLGTYSARKLGMQSTGNAGGAHNLLLAPGSEDLDGLLQRMGRGVLVTELLGQGINYVTGDYSRGMAGFWVEDGRIQYPVHEVTIAGNLREMFRNIVAVGKDVHVRGGKRCGSILIERMKIAGQ